MTYPAYLIHLGAGRDPTFCAHERAPKNASLIKNSKNAFKKTDKNHP